MFQIARMRLVVVRIASVPTAACVSRLPPNAWRAIIRAPMLEVISKRATV